MGGTRGAAAVKQICLLDILGTQAIPLTKIRAAIPAHNGVHSASGKGNKNNLKKKKRVERGLSVEIGKVLGAGDLKFVKVVAFDNCPHELAFKAVGLGAVAVKLASNADALFSSSRVPSLFTANVWEIVQLSNP